MGHSKGDIVPRGVRGSSPVGTSTFVLLRAIEPFFQRYLLQTQPLTTKLLPTLGIKTTIPPPPANGYLTNSPLITILGLNLTPFQTILFLLSVLATTKQIFWILFTSKEVMPVNGALIIAAFNFVNNALNVLIFSLAAVNPTYSTPWSMYAGLSLFILGILVEPIAEVQRKRFKDDPRNEGKAYAGGLFGFARSINYGAYTFWRSGFAIAAGGWLWGGLVATFFVWDFATRAVPTMEEYCAKRYGKQWEEVKRKVPYKLFPWIY
jgi:protein-S-isoprenylcysteine O-methyltransferase Ste14